MSFGFFFFYCCVDRRDLHSFPTRRSSDLGGTVSGLSGTVVLQDNGGDDLSVSSNGAFRSEEHTSELQSRPHIVWRILLEKKCQVSAGTGTVASANVTNIGVSCTAAGGISG